MYYKRHPNFFSLGLGSFISGENRWDYLLRPMTSHFFRVLFWLQLVWNGIETFWSMAFLFLFAWVIKRLIFQFDYFCSFVYLFIAKGFLSTSSTFLSTSWWRSIVKRGIFVIKTSTGIKGMLHLLKNVINTSLKFQCFEFDMVKLWKLWHSSC